MNLIQEGIEKGLIKFDDEQKYITYIHQNKRRNFDNPEEKVQAESFLKLVLIYGYNPERIEQFASVKIGSDTREADIIVYNNDEHTSAHIVVECKKEDVSELEFNQAISQAFSYSATGTVRARYFWVTSKIKDAYFEIPKKEPKKYLSIPDVPQYGIDKLAKYKYAKGGGEINGQKLFELEAVLEDELTRRFKQAHNSLWGGGELNPSEAFDELDKLIFCKIWDERKPRKKGEAYDFQIFSENTEAKINKELQNRINALYAEGREKDPEVFKDDIRLSIEKLRTVVGYLESIHLGNTDLDSKGRAFETFMGSFFRGDFGQYFTPRPIVKFIVDTLPITNDSLVLDTSCGSGGFLLHALDKVRQQASDYYPDFENNPKEAQSHYKHWHDFAEKNLYGIEINEQIARTAKMNMIIHDDGHTNVIATDGLLPVDDIKDTDGNITQEGIYSRTQNKGFAFNRFDFIITNPPFGSSIKQTEQAYMHQYGYAIKEVDWLNPKSKKTSRDNQSTKILFIEQCHKFLTEGGYLAMVIPDGVLTNSSLQYVRDGIEENYRIVAIVSIPQTAFQATGAGVKSSVMFLKKHSAETVEQIKNQNIGFQDSIKEDNDYLKKLQQIEKEKKQHIKELKGFENPEGLGGKALTQSEDYKEWKKEVNTEYKEKVDALKETLNEQYLAQRQKALSDYPIFMGIAEDIGYDATGKPTNNNELDIIGNELARFIAAVEKGGGMSFQLSSALDKNKVFLVNSCGLEGRLDPFFYTPQFDDVKRIEKLSKYPIKKVSHLSIVVTDGIHKTPSYDKEGLPFIQANNISEGSIDFKNNIKKVTEQWQTEVLNRYTPKAGDVLVTKDGTIGIAATVPSKFSPFSIFVSVLVIRPREDLIIPEYLRIMISSEIVQKQIVRATRGAVLSHLLLEETRELKIPIPSKKTQAEIVNIINLSNIEKKQKEAEAQQILASIDDYIFGELGIDLPKREKNTIKSRIFTRKFNELSGGRFDPFFYQNHYENIIEILNQRNDTFQLIDLLQTLESGNRPKGGVSNIESGILSLGGEHVNNQCEVETNKPKYIPLDFHKLHKNTETQLKDLLLVKDGATTGKIGIINKKEHAGQNVNEHLFILRTTENVNPNYLLNYLNSYIGNMLIKRDITGATVTGITRDVVKRLKIIIPGIEKQTEIANYITEIRNQAKELQQQAKKELEQAKEEVESMILGADESKA